MSTAREKNLRRIDACGILDSHWYVQRYPDVPALGVSAAEHYLDVGARLLRDPGPGFDTAFYLKAHRDVAASGMNPLLHYIAYGRKEGRACRPPSDPAPLLRRRVLTGARARIADRKTILVTAHLARRELFGGERSLLDVLEGLAESFNVVVTTPGGSGAYLEALRSHCIQVVAFRCDWWRKSTAPDESAVAQYCGLISEHDVAAVHANTIMLREPLVAARRMGIPGVVHARELISHDRQLCGVIGEAPGKIIQDVMASADWLIANSDATARCFGQGPRTEVVANTVDMQLMDIAPVAAQEDIRVALISNNLPKKGVDDLVAVAALLCKRVPNAKFLLIGPPNDHLRRLQREQADGMLPANIVFAGYREDPAAAVAEADIVLNLSHFKESFGRTVLEAMAARRPVVVYDWGALPELVIDGETGFVVPFRNIDAVADRIAELCDDRARMRAMGEAGRERARALFGKDHYAERLRRVYARVLEPSGSLPARMTLPARNERLTATERTPPRIAYVLWHFPVPSETFVLNELRVLVAQGHDVRVFCRASPYPEFQPDFPIRWERVDSAADLARRLLDSGRTVVHAHFTYPTVTELAWPACELAGIPFTFIAHAQDIFKYDSDAKNQIGRIAHSPLCLKVLVLSRFHRDYVECRGVPAAKIMINPNGIDPELHAGGRDPRRAARRTRKICAVHRFTEKKGLELLIRACRSLGDDGIQLDLYGYGALEPHYRSIIEEEKLDNVFLRGRIDNREQLLAVFREHDLFVCPSVRAPDGDMDGIPTVLMEAMAGGLPVLATAISGIPDLVRDGITGLVCEADPQSIADAVRRYYAASDVDVAAMIEAADALVRRDFDISPLTANLLRLWQQRPIDLMIVSWNNLPQLKEVVRRLRRFTALPFHLIICDNGSDPDVIAYLCELHAAHDDTTIVLNRQNAFVGPGTNLCLAQGRADYAVYVCGKEGFVIDHGWDARLVRYMDDHPDVGLGGTLVYAPNYLHGSQYPSGIPEFPRFRNPQFAQAHPERRFAHVQGGLFAIRRRMFDAIGGFSEAVPHGYTDVEYSYFAESCGWKLGAIPSLRSLFHKTRPGLWSRIDESVAAVHPPKLDDLRLLDRVVRRDVALCNLCGWHGDDFATSGELPACPQCGSVPADRSLFRLLADSTLTFRQLPATGIGVGHALEAIWREQFQGNLIGTDTAVPHARACEGLPEDRSLAFVYLNGVLDGSPADAAVLRKIDQALNGQGVCAIRLADTLCKAGASETPVAPLAADFGFAIEAVRYSSSVLRYDTSPLYVCRRNGSDEPLS